MKLVVFGANGPTGRLLTRQLLDADHFVAAVTRRPATFPITDPRLTVAQADVFQQQAVAGVLPGADAVLSALGVPFTRRPVDTFSTGTANIAAAMRRNEIRRLIVVSSTATQHYRNRRNSSLLQRIFENAKTVRPWVSTGRFQYTSTQTVGRRWCMMSHAAGFIDPLYSRGLSNSGEVIDALAWRLLEALKDDDFSEERFEYVGRLQAAQIRYNDDLVNSSFVSWSDWELWNAVYRVWAASQMPASMRLNGALERFRAGGGDQVFKDLEKEEFVGSLLPTKGYEELFGEMVRLCDAVDHGEMESGAAGRELMQRVVSSPAVLPMQGLADPQTRFVAKTRESFLTLAKWIGEEGPEEMRFLVDNPKIQHALRLQAQGKLGEGSRIPD